MAQAEKAQNQMDERKPNSKETSDPVKPTQEEEGEDSNSDSSDEATGTTKKQQE